jgi:hypothetical protein
MVQSAVSYIGIALNVILLVLLSRGYIHKHRLLFAYAVVHLCTGVLENLVLYANGNGTPYNNFYWADEVLVDLLLFLMVIMLIRQAAAGRPTGAAASKIMIVVLVAAVVLPFVFGKFPIVPERTPFRLSGRWFITASQVLNFGGAIMNLVLWGNLIGTRQRDPRMLTICAGLGIAITGEAIRYGLLALFTSSGLRQVADVFGGLTHMAGWAIWCWAFRPGTAPAAGPPGSGTSSGY